MSLSSLYTSSVIRCHSCMSVTVTNRFPRVNANIIQTFEHCFFFIILPFIFDVNHFLLGAVEFMKQSEAETIPLLSMIDVHEIPLLIHVLDYHENFSNLIK